MCVCVCGRVSVEGKPAMGEMVFGGKAAEAMKVLGLTDDDDG